MIYIIIFRHAEGSFISVSKEGKIFGGNDIEKVKEIFPDYNRYHVANNTWGASATIWWMTFHPCIVELNSSDELAQYILEPSVYRLGGLAGSELGCKVNPDILKFKVWEKPLIDKGIENAKPFYEK